MAALLPPDADALLLEVADIYERHLPRSLPLSAWPHGRPASTAPARCLARVVHGRDRDRRAGCGGLEQTLDKHPRPAWHALQAFANEPFAKMLAQALDRVARCCAACVPAIRSRPTHWPMRWKASRCRGAGGVHGQRSEGRPWFKPAWNPDYALASDYPLDFLLVRRELAQSCTTLRTRSSHGSALARAGSTAWTASCMCRACCIACVAAERREGAERFAAASRALHAVRRRQRWKALISTAGRTHAARRVRHPLPDGAKEMTVSLVIPTRDHADLLSAASTRSAVHRVAEAGNHRHRQRLHQETTHAYFAELAQQGVRVLPMPGPSTMRT